MTVMPDMKPGNYLVTVMDGGYRIWNAKYLTTEDVGNDAGDPTALLQVWFGNLNAQSDEEMRAALDED